MRILPVDSCGEEERIREKQHTRGRDDRATQSAFSAGFAFPEDEERFGAALVKSNHENNSVAFWMIPSALMSVMRQTLFCARWAKRTESWAWARLAPAASIRAGMVV